MNYLAKNLKFLRKEKGLTQSDFALKIGINRPKVGSYEEGRAEPTLETLQTISHFFKLRLDDLLEKDLSRKKQKIPKDYNGNDLRVLPILVNESQKEYISLVPIKAAAGYLNGFSDPEFVEELPHFNLPFQEVSQGTFRAFQIKGDSMLPIPSGAFILAEYLADWQEVKNHQCYVFISKNEGIVYKRALNRLKEDQLFELHSDNKIYEPYQLQAEEVLEIWKAKGFISFDLPDVPDATFSVDQLSNMVMQLKNDLDQLKKN
tara:strand:+ start:3404 stop:4186 length:783 start_codon:yes stop_codon:yes gene_type:complete